MKQKIKYLAAGVLIGATVAGTAGVFAYTDYIEAVYNNIKIVVNGKEIHPDSEPFISNGTTYLPVRAVAEALGQPVDWDGPNHTVYIGSMNGGLEYPTLMLKNANNIGNSQNWVEELEGETLVDNYGNTYSNGLWICGRFGEQYIETLLNGKYSRFKATLYVSQDYIIDKPVSITIEADGHEIYSSPQFTKTSRPVDVDLNISGYNDFKIICNTEYNDWYNWEEQGLCIGNAGFYQ